MPERPYQKRGIKFALRKKNAFLMADMGLGKTLMSIRVVQEVKIPTLVFAPLQPLYETWPTEIEKWSDLTYTILHGPNKAMNLHLKKQIYLLNYEGLKWFFNQCAKGSFKARKLLFIWDESSMIKDPRSQRFKLMEKFRPWFAPVRLALSATPASAGLQNLWSQSKLLDSGKRLGNSYWKFKRDYFVESGAPHYRISPLPFAKQRIFSRINDICFRLDANDHVQMPDVIRNAVNITLPSHVRKAYDKLQDDFMLEWENGDLAIAHSQNSLVNKLRQFISGALYLKEGGYRVIHRLKCEALQYACEALPGRCIIVAINFHFEVDMIRKWFKREVPVVNSTVNLPTKQMLFKKWNNGNLPLLLAHPKSMGHGLNLQDGGHNIIYYSMPWSLDQYKQLIGRLARPGQKERAVTVQHLIAKGTIDEVVFQCLERHNATQEEFLSAVKKEISYG